MTKCYKIDTSLYNQDVYFILADTGKEAGAFINKKFKDNIDKCDGDDKCRGFQWKTHFPIDGFERGRFFLYVNLKEIHVDNTTVDHEVIHLSWSLLDHLGIDLSPDNHEAQTYLYEHLIKQFKKIIKTFQLPK